MRKLCALILSLVSLFALAFGLSSCVKSDDDWRSKGYDLSKPALNQDGWYMVFEDEFEGDELNQNIKFGDGYVGNKEIWTTSPHKNRWPSNTESKPEQACWWCADMYEVKDGKCYIYSKQETNHVCSSDICPASGRFTTGIETRRLSDAEGDTKGDGDVLLFAQAFGYFEATVKFPDVDGLWSAFWLQSSNQRKVSAEGVDGTEIDVYESAFRGSSKSKMGHALLWNGYGEYSKVNDFIAPLEQDLYDGYHTFGLKWTPEYYVFYIDGEPTWASMGGGVSHVKEFLRLTVEIDAGDGYGPHGQKIGQFKDSSSEFIIDNVKVWQNENYSQFEIDDSQFSGTLDKKN